MAGVSQPCHLVFTLASSFTGKAGRSVLRTHRIFLVLLFSDERVQSRHIGGHTVTVGLGEKYDDDGTW